ncbi:syntaxin binding protein 6 (amisyn), like isoform X2 [Cololabis saira]|uniref:syntaxin binding protein 6 (amisyn), like isoform X2 n=1 Tax=Cololabis saira TaxID=129043 RepID=UPI002AD4CA6E|nr:syntaxin binding protein 6 (amisyn), like isoform X2 [Cololabis saira]
MNVQSAINRELFVPRDERMLVAVEVRRRTKKRMSFLPAGSKGDYATFICVSVSNTRPQQLFITKVKRFVGSPSFTRRSQWTVEQLRKVNGINPNKDSPEFDLVFDNAADQWVAGSSAEKCIFIQILYHACQTHWGGIPKSVAHLGKLGKASLQRRASQPAPSETGGGSRESPKSRTLQARRKSLAPPRQTEFINCQSKLTGGATSMNLVVYRCKAFLNRVKKMVVKGQGRASRQGPAGHRATDRTMADVVHRMNVALGERGHRLTQAEDSTVKLMHKAQQFADTAHKLMQKYSK